jgi:hypothetical protein
MRVLLLGGTNIVGPSAAKSFEKNTRWPSRTPAPMSIQASLPRTPLLNQRPDGAAVDDMHMARRSLERDP